jgi:NAD(P)-dependent dehydrogenase (short-subunit alcohol dehydrogenase family)
MVKTALSTMEKKVILITGASGALGKQIAAYLESQGHTLILHYFQHPIRTENPNVMTIACDLRSPSEMEEMINQVISRFGRIDVLINNAGISKSNVAWKTTAEAWRQTMQINLDAPFFLSQAVIPSMRAYAFGRIINITSVVAQTGFVGTSAYAASKAGLIGLTKTLSKELAKFHIAVNAIALGYFNTGMIEDVPAEVQAKLLEQVPVNQLGDPLLLAKMIDFLISPEADFITGQTLNLNGGLYS